ncbi:MAG: DNA polymerase III subunit delta [Muribaculaceae bacterium]
MSEIEQGRFMPIYVLEGEESYYIDSLSDKIIEKALTEDERDFNLTICYGIDADIRQVIGACKRYPVMAERQVVVLREAQNVRDSKENGLELFRFYAQNPLKSTILVICNKGGNIKAPEFLKQLKASQTGVVFESKKETERSIMDVITKYVASKGCKIDEKSTSMLRDFVGTDVARLFGEVDKLSILVGADRKITPEMIEKNIGISKDYNIFELEDALFTRNREKAFKIIDYFEKNPKNNPVQLVTPFLFNAFVGILLVRTSKDQSPDAIMDRIGTKSNWRAQKFMSASSRYTTLACVNIIDAIRRFDAQSKGIGSRQNGYDLLRSLMFFILNS